MDIICFNAIQESINHWKKDIKEELEKGRNVFINTMRWMDSNESLPTGVENCSLCKLFFAGDCFECPLYESRQGCLKYNSPYRKFMNNPCLETTNKMIEALKSLLKEG
jgi:hypothetical protein